MVRDRRAPERFADLKFGSSKAAVPRSGQVIAKAKLASLLKDTPKDALASALGALLNEAPKAPKVTAPRSSRKARGGSSAGPRVPEGHRLAMAKRWTDSQTMALLRLAKAHRDDRGFIAWRKVDAVVRGGGEPVLEGRLPYAYSRNNHAHFFKKYKRLIEQRASFKDPVQALIPLMY